MNWKKIISCLINIHIYVTTNNISLNNQEIIIIFWKIGINKLKLNIKQYRLYR